MSINEKIKVFIKRNIKLFIIKIFYVLNLDLLYFKKKSRFEVVIENSKYLSIMFVLIYFLYIQNYTIVKIDYYPLYRYNGIMFN